MGSEYHRVQEIFDKLPWREEKIREEHLALVQPTLDNKIPFVSGGEGSEENRRRLDDLEGELNDRSKLNALYFGNPAEKLTAFREILQIAAAGGGRQ